MRRNGRLLFEVMQEVCAAVKPGVTTKELDTLAQRRIEDKGARPAFLGLYGFPATLCVSVNEQVVHGIPSPDCALEEGSIVSIDCGLELDGYMSDMARTMPVGRIRPELQRLLDVTRECLELAIQTMRVGMRLGDLGRAVQEHAEGNGFGVVRRYSGHGIGRLMHEAPEVFNFFDPQNNKRFQNGWVLAVEPMINMGVAETVELPDGWTVVTKDRLPSAHFEDTVAIVDGGPVILTRP
ncbi:type I methionyl aminopeptidase [Candidatus Sumerlaeota bacterium]|nr:type I methionyl aminopeptidase [Candidatus Sumerlaeota bacterium]